MTTLDAHEIAPRLWMGSAPPPGPLLARCEFDLVVLCAYEYQPTAEWFPGVEVARICLDDADLSASDALTAFQLAAQVAKALKSRKKVLVTCRQGRNRSGLLTALALTQYTGCSGYDAVKTVRARRTSRHGPALTNEHYVDALLGVPAAQARGEITKNAARAARLAG